MQITVDENSFDARQDREYKKLGGSVSAGIAFLVLSLGVRVHKNIGLKLEKAGVSEFLLKSVLSKLIVLGLSMILQF